MELVEILAEAMRHPIEGDEMNQYSLYRNYARRSLSALHSRGLAFVPVEPTGAMIEAGQDYVTRGDIWSAMISASPSLKGEG